MAPLIKNSLKLPNQEPLDIFKEVTLNHRMKLRRARDSGVMAAIEAAGTLAALGQKLGISAQAISEWRRIPAERVLQVESATGVPRSHLREDLYPVEDECTHAA
jgi:DNA-binding transcriptional regulator YdaS (Cro superfamily)